MTRNFTVCKHQGRVGVQISGTTQVSTAVELISAMAAIDGSSDIVIDWKRAEHLDGSTLQALLSVKKSPGGDKRRFGVIDDNPRIREFLMLCGLAEHFPVIAEPANKSEKADG